MSIRLIVFFLILFSSVASTGAEVTRIEIASTVPFNEGAVFGDIGPYEYSTGRVHYAVDPDDPRNRSVVDLEHAPRDLDGRVVFTADFRLLTPRNSAEASGTLFYTVNNRGGVLPASAGPRSPINLLDRGHVLVMSGWDAELLPESTRLRLNAPTATYADRPIKGMVRVELGTGPGPDTLLSVNGRGHAGYEPTGGSATLTRRSRESDIRIPVDRSRFRILSIPQADGLPLVQLEMKDGFKPYQIYELIYEAQNPVVQGLGFVAVRDLVAFLRHEVSDRNPLVRQNQSISHTIGYGVSQSGRFLRQFLYEGFNADGQGRRVFDGLIPLVAGGGMGCFNYRFASPTRTNTQSLDHLFPSDVFPFTYGDETNPFTGEVDGILRRARADGVVPKVMHTQTSAEYWHRSGSLVHTDPKGVRDSVIPEEVRIYTIGGAQHGSGSGEPRPGGAGQNWRNHTNYRSIVIGLIDVMNDWIRDNAPPPDSRYPRLADGTLADWKANAAGWVSLPGVLYPTVIQQPVHANYGPDFEEHGIISVHPPNVEGQFIVRVPNLDADNNDRGTIRLPALAYPLGTYTGWNLVKGTGAEVLLRLNGSYIPFARTEADRRANGDPRRSLEERYASFPEYLEKYTASARKLAEERYIRKSDIQLLIELAKKNRTAFLDTTD